MPKEPRKPSFLLSLVPFAVLVVLMFFVIRLFGADALDGASQVALVLAAGVVIALAMGICRVPWGDIEAAIAENIHNIGSAIIILLLIGAIGGSWMVSGVVPTLIVYGLKVITPGIYLFAACLICALVSLMTGSSWTTIATLGVALIAIGTALGYSPAWCAGAIISGAYFGDKISPLSDTTILASSMASVPLFTHIRHMLYTTGPAFGISLVIYLTVSILHPAVGDARIAEVEAVMRSSFNISPWLLIVPVLTGVMIWKKVPAILTLLGASLMAGVAALVAQPDLVVEVSGLGGPLSFASGFKGLFVIFSSSTAIATGSESVDSLVATGGMNGMLPTVFLIVCAATFGDSMVGSGMIRSITEALTKRITSRVGLVGATLATGVFSNLIMGDQYLSIILTSRLYKELYEKLRFEGKLLSRSVEDSATITSVLVPWNSCGMTQSTVLRVSTAAYFPFCFFNILSPFCSLAAAVISSRRARRPSR